MPPKHECALVGEPSGFDVVMQCIDTGMFIETRRKMRRLTMISPKHPRTQFYIRSSNALKEEEARHLLQYPQMIHPFSLGRLYWEFVMLIVYTMFFILIPIEMYLPQRKSRMRVQNILVSLNLFQFVDIVVQLTTGYYNKNKNHVILQPSEVIKNYLFGMFFIDLGSSLPSYLIALTEKMSKFYQYALALKYFGMLKIFRFFTWYNSLQMLRAYRQIPSAYFRAPLFVAIFFITIFWSFAFCHFLRNATLLTNENKAQFLEISKRDIVKEFYYTVRMLLMVGYQSEVHDSRENSLEIFIALCFVVFGFCLSMFIYLKIYQFWDKFSSAESSRVTAMRQLTSYVEYNNIPMYLRDNISTYFDYRYQRQYYKESVINKISSPHLHKDIILNSIFPLVDRIGMFQFLPKELRIQLAEAMVSKIYLPGDIILKVGESGSSMYILCFGTIAVYSPAGREICHLEDGAHFGQFGMIFKERRFVSVIALTCCELLKLTRTDFRNVAGDADPETIEKLENYVAVNIHQDKLDKRWTSPRSSR